MYYNQFLLFYKTNRPDGGAEDFILLLTLFLFLLIMFFPLLLLIGKLGVIKNMTNRRIIFWTNLNQIKAFIFG